MSTIITRTGFCPHCFQEGKPRKENICLLYGGTNSVFKVHTITDRSRTKGYTPFIYMIDRVIEENVVGCRICAMYDCGTNKRFENDTWFYYLDKTKWERFIYPIKTWNALVNFKDHSYYI